MQWDETVERDGPVPVPGDSWVDAPTSARHRLKGSGRSRRYLWVLPVLALIAGSPVIVSLFSDDADDPGGPGAGASRPPSSSAAGWPTGPGIVVVTAPPPQSGSAMVGGPGMPPSGSTTTTGEPTTGGPTTGVPTTVPPTTAGLPLAYEAEGPLVRLRSAEVVDLAGASGGKAVRYLRSSSGLVEFRSIAVAAPGSFRVTIVYAARGEWRASVDGSGAPATVTFAAGSGCCESVSVVVPLTPGGSLAIQPSTGTGTLPLIDRIRIDAA